jgi:hypothetical protein
MVTDISKGKHGDYAVARLKDSIPGVTGTVTISLTADVWEDRKLPERGTMVMLFDLWRKKSGWRAGRARLERPSDST